MVEAAIPVHGPVDSGTPEGTFPTMQDIGPPRDADARARLADGTSAIEERLPCRVVALVDLFATLLLPLPRALRELRAFRVRRHYARIRKIKADARRGRTPPSGGRASAAGQRDRP